MQLFPCEFRADSYVLLESGGLGELGLILIHFRTKLSTKEPLMEDIFGGAVSQYIGLSTCLLVSSS